ncbi:hypothetical protein AB0O01_02075 [Streptomyces sp. NPDC093252]|uniref:hypothetical protein n=1 Tax=Streptomyces sp. NPDC093252 TaxID=3154980 RepID=UPI003430B32E
MGNLLSEIQRIPTSAARAVEYFEVDGAGHLIVPQLAYDAEGSPGGMNGGNSNTDVLVLRREGDTFTPAGKLPGTGGEDAEFFEIDGRRFLAVASIRIGSGPYNFLTGSPIYEWTDGGFVPFQTVSSYAAKQWRHFEIEGTHFLALAQNRPGDLDVSSAVFRWSGERFERFQDIPSRGGYNFAYFSLDGQHYLAHADHVLPSRLYRWDGTAFVDHQDLVPTGGRAFAPITTAGTTYLAVASMFSESQLLRWNGGEFVAHATLEGGPGGREFAVVDAPGGPYLVRVTFVTGGQANPTPQQTSYVYRIQDGKPEVVDTFATTGGTDAVVIPAEDGGILLAVSNALAPDVTFATDTVLYRFDAS